MEDDYKKIFETGDNAKALEILIPPCIIVDEKSGKILMAYGKYDRVLKLPVGEVKFDLKNSLDSSLRIAVTSSILEAKKTNSIIKCDGVSFTNGHGEKKSTDIVVYALNPNVKGLEKYYTVFFACLRDTDKQVKRINKYDSAETLKQYLIDAETEKEKYFSYIYQLEDAIEKLPLSFLTCDLDGIVTYVNSKFVEMTGFDKNEVVGKSVCDIRSHKLLNTEYKTVFGKLRKNEVYSYEIENIKKDGACYIERATVYPIYNESNKPCKYARVCEDLTDVKDELTGLNSRKMFEIHVNMIINSHDNNKQFGILFFDIDNFKYINDTMGHMYGDNLLKSVGERVSSMLEPKDYLARFGGDEFLIYVDDIKKIRPLADKITNSFKTPFFVDGTEQSVTLSIGIILYPENARDYSSLIRGADIAMYEAKKMGGENYKYFDHGINDYLLVRIETERKLQKAINNNEIDVYFQPIINTKTGKITSFEALARWFPKNSKNPIMPKEFIPLSEKSILIVKLTERVLNIALDHLKVWLDLGYKDLCVSVNISFALFNRCDLYELIVNCVEGSGCPYTNLIIEVTESVEMQNSDEHVNQLIKLKNLGIKIAFDDFGTGYSSLHRLSDLPFDAIKIDKSFTKLNTFENKGKSLLKVINFLAQEMGVYSVAEGVETKEQVNYIKKVGCERMQGFLIAKPMKASDATAFLINCKGFVDIDKLQKKES